MRNKLLEPCFRKTVKKVLNLHLGKGFGKLEKRVCNKQTAPAFRKEELPTFIPVYHYSNLISNLLVEVPLYEPLIGKKRDGDGMQDLTVTILGTGFIGTEMFMTTYWMGQMLNCRLKINVLSQEKEKQFWNKIDYVNPEIRLTTQDNNSILAYNKKGDKNDVYCKVNYIQCDVKSSQFVSGLLQKEDGIVDTDYFFVALGSDEDNISVANTVRQYVGQHHISTSRDDKTVIAYVVYDPALSESLNNQTHFGYVKDKVDIYMRAIGSLYDVYSVKNVFMNEYDPLDDTDEIAINTHEERKKRAIIHENRIKEDNYRHWSSMARDMHAKYKVYSMGLITTSIFEYSGAMDDYKKAAKDACLSYSDIFDGKIEIESHKKEKHMALVHELSWLEHRRWNAYMRTKGFRSVSESEYKAYTVEGKKGSYKQMDLKLHPCLVECDKKGMRASVSVDGKADPYTLLKNYDPETSDLLDDLSYELNKMGCYSGDFKKNDYPRSLRKNNKMPQSKK